MIAQKLEKYCSSKLGAVLEYPFGPEPAVFKAGGKMFAVVYEETDVAKISMKCEPLLADFLRQQHLSVTPGYHFDKAHWNTVLCNGKLQYE